MAQHYRTGGDHGPPTPHAQILGAQIRCGGDLRRIAVEAIAAALIVADGDRGRAAERLGVSRSSLMRWLRLPELQKRKADFPAKYTGCVARRTDDSA